MIFALAGRICCCKEGVGITVICWPFAFVIVIGCESDALAIVCMPAAAFGTERSKHFRRCLSNEFFSRKCHQNLQAFDAAATGLDVIDVKFCDGTITTFCCCAAPAPWAACNPGIPCTKDQKMRYFHHEGEKIELKFRWLNYLVVDSLEPIELVESGHLVWLY